MPEVINYTLSFLIGYLIGSFPSAYLLVKWKSSIDLRTSGSGIIGTLNTLEVTGNKWLGITVLIIDMLKGTTATIIGIILWNEQFYLTAVTGLSAIVGHNFSIWLKFKGGRGLATTAGMMLVLGWIFIALWCIIFGFTYLFSKHIYISNITASIISPILIWLTPIHAVQFLLPITLSHTQLSTIVTCACVIVLLGHTKPIKELLFQRNFK